MKPSKKRYLAVALAAGLLLTGCSSGTGGGDSPDADCEPLAEFPTLTDGVLTIAAVNGMPKLEAEPGSGVADGISGRNISSFADAMCLTRNWMPLAGAAAVETMGSGRADIAAADWVRSAQRGEVMGQSDTIWYEIPSITSREGYESISELQGKTVGTTSGSGWIPALNAALGESNVRTYDLAASAFADLLAGRIDAVYQSGSEASYRKQQEGWEDVTVVLLAPEPDFPDLTTPFELNWPYTKSNTELGDAINLYIAQLREDGTVERLLAEYGLTDPAFLTGTFDD